MIVGGKVLKDGSWKSSDKAYAMSLNPTVNVPRCLESMCDYDHYVTHPATAIFQDGLPTVCGGWDSGSNTFYKDCHKYNFTNAWDDAGSIEQWSTSTWTYSRHYPTMKKS